MAKSLSFYDLFATWQFDKKLNTSNLLGHITYAHFYPNNFQAMNVKRAFQMLSARFAAAISTAGQSDVLKSSSWKTSADFVCKMNKVIDVMNVYHLNNWKGEKGPLSDINSMAEELLISFIEWCSKWSTSPNKISRPPCFDGMIMTVQAILSTYRSIKQDHPCFKFATALCNQDSVEHTFGKIRGRGGFNPNPTARMVRLTLRHILSSGYIYGSQRGNVTCQETSSLTDGTSLVHGEMETNNVSLQEEFIFSTEMDEDSDNLIATAFEEITQYSEQNYFDDNLEIINTDKDNLNLTELYERNAIAYFAGYIARHGYETTKCDSCREKNLKTPMEGSNENEIYIQLREYKHQDEDEPEIEWLSRPTDSFLNIISLQLESINSYYKKFWHLKDVKKKLLEICIKHVQHADEDWFNQNNECYQHRIEMLDFMLRVKIYAIAKKNNNRGRERINTASGKSKEIKTKCQKLKNIKHM